VALLLRKEGMNLNKSFWEIEIEIEDVGWKHKKTKRRRRKKKKGAVRKVEGLVWKRKKREESPWNESVETDHDTERKERHEETQHEEKEKEEDDGDDEKKWKKKKKGFERNSSFGLAQQQTSSWNALCPW